MTEKIDSKSVVKPNDVEVTVPTKFQLFLDAAPDLMKHLTAVVAVGVVVVVCFFIIFSKDSDLSQFKQAAFTTLIGIGTGALGYLFGASQNQGE